MTISSPHSSQLHDSTLTQRATTQSTSLSSNAITTSSTLPSTNPSSSPTARFFDQSTGILLGLNISMLECLFILMEFIFGTVIFPAVWRLVLQYPCSKLYPQHICDEIYRILGYFTIVYWLLHRCSWTILQSFETVLKYLQYSFNPDLYITPYPNTNKKPNHNILYYFFSAHAISIMIMLVLQFITGEKIYCLDNFFVEESTATGLIQNLPLAVPLNVTHSLANATDTVLSAVTDATAATAELVFSPLRMAFLMVIAPFFEELIFRCVMLTFVHLRIAKYFPGRIQLTEVIEKERELFNKPKKVKKQVIVRRTKDSTTTNHQSTQDQQQDQSKPLNLPENHQQLQTIEDTQHNDGLDTKPTVLQPVDSHYKAAPFNIAQYSTVISAVAFGLIHLINILNGFNTYYVILQAIVGVLIGIVLNAAAYQYGHLAALLIHIVNNIISSFISQNTDIFASKLFTFGFFETILCYGILAFLSLKNLSNTESQQIPYIIKTAPIPVTASSPTSTPPPHLQEIITIDIPRHYHAFNNRFVHHSCQQCDLPH